MNAMTEITMTDQSSTLIEIDKLVNYILDTPIIPGLTDDTILQALHQQILPAIPRYLAVYSTDYSYTKEIGFFLKSLSELDVARCTFHQGVPFETKHINYLLGMMQDENNLNSLKRRKHDRLYQSKKTHESLVRYATLLHQKYSRLLVIRVDLYYSKEAQQQITIDTVYQHLDQMNQQRYTNDKVFEHLVGSIWRVEQAETRGYHLHMAYYFLGSKHQNDWFKAQQIGELWKQLTGDLGTYHSCHTPEVKKHYQEKGILGVGMIHRDQPNEVQNAINTVSYLARPSKQDQYLRIAPFVRRPFGKSITP